MFTSRTTLITRSVGQAARNVRKMSGSSAEAQVEAGKWKTYSAIMIVLSGTFGAYNVMTAEHPHGRHDMPFMKIRNKPFPWRECPDCDILDGDCWAKCRAEK